MTQGILPGAVDEMWWSDAEEMHAYWREFPPAHVLLRAQVGFKPDDEDGDEPPTPGAY